MKKMKEYSFEQKLAIANFIIDIAWLLSSYYLRVNLSLMLGVSSIILSAYMFLRALLKSGGVKIPLKLPIGRQRSL
jgi:hypothetical protein